MWHMFLHNFRVTLFSTISYTKRRYTVEIWATVVICKWVTWGHNASSHFFNIIYGNDHFIRHKHLNFRRHTYSNKNVLRLRKHLFTIYLLNTHVFRLIHSACPQSIWFTSTSILHRISAYFVNCFDVTVLESRPMIQVLWDMYIKKLCIFSTLKHLDWSVGLKNKSKWWIRDINVHQTGWKQFRAFYRIWSISSFMDLFKNIINVMECLVWFSWWEI